MTSRALVALFVLVGGCAVGTETRTEFDQVAGDVPPMAEASLVIVLHNRSSVDLDYWFKTSAGMEGGSSGGSLTACFRTAMAFDVQPGQSWEFRVFNEAAEMPPPESAAPRLLLDSQRRGDLAPPPQGFRQVEIIFTNGGSGVSSNRTFPGEPAVPEWEQEPIEGCAA